MHRARLLVIKAHPDLAHAPRERILITSFLLGLYDRQLASSLAVVKIQTAADAERLAAEGEAVRRDQRPRRSTSNFLPEGACAPELYDPDEPLDAESLDEEEEELTAALGTATPSQFSIQSESPQNDGRRRVPQGATDVVNTVTSSPNAPDRIAKGPDASPHELSLNVCSAKVTISYVIVHHCLQLSKRLRTQDKFE